MINSFAPNVLQNSINPIEQIVPKLMNKTVYSRGTVFVFDSQSFWQLNDVVILPCLIATESLQLFGLETKPIKDGLFTLGDFKFSRYNKVNNWIYYF